MSILHVKLTRPAYVQFVYLFVRLDWKGAFTRAPVGGTNAIGGPLTNGGIPPNPP
jgi:hypothetical protein